MASAAWSSCCARTAALTGEACQRGLPSDAEQIICSGVVSNDNVPRMELCLFLHSRISWSLTATPAPGRVSR
jgi:hypothetical protein